MRYQIPEEEQERLDQLNEWFTQILCSKDYYDDEKWLAIRLNLLKWNESGYSFKYLNLSKVNDFDEKEIVVVYKIYNSLSEIDLLAFANKEAAKDQKYEKAALYRDLGKLCVNSLKGLYENSELVIPFFMVQEATLVLKHIENYFINQYIKERLRK
jgi:hypothetical protein